MNSRQMSILLLALCWHAGACSCETDSNYYHDADADADSDADDDSVEHCKVDADCTEPDLCVDDRCVPRACIDSLDCPPPYFCIPATGTCGELQCYDTPMCGQDDSRYCSWDTWSCESSCSVTGCGPEEVCDTFSRECLQPDPSVSCSVFPSTPVPFGVVFGGNQISMDVGTALPSEHQLGGVLVQFDEAEEQTGAIFRIDRSGYSLVEGLLPFDWAGQDPLPVGEIVVAKIHDLDDDGRVLTLSSRTGVPLYTLALSIAEGDDPAVPAGLRYAQIDIGCPPRRFHSWWQAVGSLVVGPLESDDPEEIEIGTTSEISNGPVSYAVHNLASWYTGSNPTFDVSCDGVGCGGTAIITSVLSYSECVDAEQCPADFPVCDQGMCVAGCPDTPCKGASPCDEASGICMSGSCSNELSYRCDPPWAFCDRDVLRCRPGCLISSCPDGDTYCDLRSGRCRDPLADPVCYEGGFGPIHPLLSVYQSDGLDREDGDYSSVVDEVIVSQSQDHLEWATIRFPDYDDRYEVFVQLPLPAGEGLSLSAGETVAVEYSRALPQGHPRDHELGDALVIRDSGGVLLYASVEFRADEWQVVLPELSIEPVSIGCPFRDEYYSYQEVESLRLTAGTASVEIPPRDVGTLEIEEREYTVLVVESHRRMLPAEYNELWPEVEFRQVVVVGHAQ